MRINREKKSLDTIKDFDAQTSRDTPDNGYWGYGSKWLAVRPTTGELYVYGDRDSAIIADPGSGKARTVKLPAGCVAGGLYFDIEGHAYLRDFRRIARFDPDTWREVPFDYGEKRGGLISAVPIDSPSIHGQPAFSVSVDGSIVAGFIIGHVETLDRTRDEERRRALAEWKPWKPRIFEGRGGNTIVRIWDRYGKVVQEDAVRGVGYLADAFLGKDGALYLATEAQRNGYFDPLTGTFVKFRANGKILSSEGAALPLQSKPERPPDTHKGAGHRGASWWEDAEWFYGGMGFCGKNNSTCHCPKFQSAHDYFDRTFVPETGHCSVAVLDSAGNLITRIGRYGNVDDGEPLVPDPRIPKPRPIGGDEVALFYPAYLAVHSDRRLFVNDPGNQRVASVKLGYRVSHATRFKDVRDIAPGKTP